MSFRTVLWIGGMPRSGTTWIAQVFASHPDVRLKYDPLFSFDFKNCLDLESGAADWAELFRSVYDRRSEYLDQEFLRKDGLVPDFAERCDAPGVLAIKSSRHHHLVARAVETGAPMRLLAVVRDPVDTVASWIGNPTEFPADADAATEWRTGACRRTGTGEYWGFDDWLAVTRLQLDLARRHPDRVRLVRYEDLVAGRDSAFEPLFQWLGLALHPQTLAFLDDSASRHSEHPRSVFRRADRRSSHRRRLPDGALEAMLDAVHGTELERFLVPVRNPDAAHG